MGCKESKQGGGGVEAVATGALDLSGMDRIQRFEHVLPFSKTKIDILEQKVKAQSKDKGSLSITELRQALGEEKQWGDINKDDSVICQVLKTDFFKDEENQEEINKSTFLLWGLMLCGGDAKIKARVFYDILQDNNQPYISASDKDFPVSFSKIVDLACKIPEQYEGLVSKQTPSKTQEELDKIDQVKETMQEAFLDDIYGARSKVERKDFEAKVALGQKWLFNSKSIRQTVEKAMKNSTA